MDKTEVRHMSEKLTIRAKYLDGEIHISLNTLKQILTTDLVAFLEELNAEKRLINPIEYIKDLISRFDNVSTAKREKENWWDK